MPAKVVKKNFIDFLHEIFHDSRSIGILLIVSTIISLILSNFSTGEAYTRFFSTESEWLHQLKLPHSVGHFFNDGLMAIFFFLVGLEIKRELTVGELATIQKALL